MKNAMFPLNSTSVTGASVAVAMNTVGTVVSVSRSAYLHSLNYAIGSLQSNGTLDWNPAQSLGDSGYNPTVSTATDTSGNRIVASMHDTTNVFSSTMYTNLGLIDEPSGETITWGAPQSTESGHEPHIAVDSHGGVVAVFRATSSATDSSALMIKFGQANPSNKVIAWNSGDATSFSTGRIAAVAVNGSAMLIVLVRGGQVFYRYGAYNTSSGIYPTSEHLISTIPTTPHVTRVSAALNGTGDVVLAVETSATAVPGGFIYSPVQTYFGSGDASGASTTISWITGTSYQQGRSVSVACNGNAMVLAQLGDETYYTNPNGPTTPIDNNTIYTGGAMLLGAISDRSTWMAAFDGWTLSGMCLPGAHDAGMYTVNNCSMVASVHGAGVTQTQTLTMAEMLNAGIRYFDVRPVLAEDGTYYTGHFDAGTMIGCRGVELATMLADVANFCSNTTKQVIVLKLSHFADRQADSFGFTSAQITNVLAYVHGLLGNCLFVNNTQSRLASLTLSAIAPSGSKVVLVYDPSIPEDKQGGSITAPSGTYTYADFDAANNNAHSADLVVYDEYSNKNTTSSMISDQLRKLNNSDKHGGDMFLLSWTLTQQKLDQFLGHPTILDLSVNADRLLAQNMAAEFQTGQVRNGKMPNIVYVDSADTFATDVCIWLNTAMTAPGL